MARVTIVAVGGPASLAALSSLRDERGAPGTASSASFHTGVEVLYASSMSSPQLSNHTLPGGRRAKIVCTIGPATRSAGMIDRLVRAGMDVARLNFSHGTYAEHALSVHWSARRRPLPEAHRHPGRPAGPQDSYRHARGRAPVMLRTGQTIHHLDRNGAAATPRASPSIIRAWPPKFARATASCSPTA